jgi:hypothetical protein
MDRNVIGKTVLEKGMKLICTKNRKKLKEHRISKGEIVTIYKPNFHPLSDVWTGKYYNDGYIVVQKRKRKTQFTKSYLKYFKIHKED